MRRLLEELRERIAGFVPQRDAVALVVSCTDADAALVNKIIEGVDDASDSELFWIVVDEFKNPGQFVEACVQSLAIKHQAARLAMEKQKLKPWPELPAEISRPGSLAPLDRLKKLVTFSRSLLPIPDGALVVWALFPMKIADPAAYADLMAQLWRHEYPFPWCHQARFIIRDDAASGLLARRAQDAPAVQQLRADFSPETLRKAAEEEAADDRTPLPDRINNALVLAGMDFAHQKYDLALRGYEVVHRYAAGANIPVLASVALQGMADVHHARGNKEQADKLLQAALAPAAAATSPPVPILFNLYLNLGTLRFEQKKWDEAEVFLSGAADFAMLLRDPDQRLRCWDTLGLAQYQQRKIDPALKTWSNGAIVAGKLKLQEQQQAFVRRLNSHYQQQKDEPGLRNALSRIREAISAHENAASAPPAQPQAAAQTARRPDGISR
jgi:tetratricopeptide (TPR) repeat protein